MRKISTGIVTSLLILGLLLNFEMGFENVSGYTPHDPILITGNAGFRNPANGVSNWDDPLAGTESNPFIIGGWEIDIKGSESDGIDIMTTDAYFIIRK